MLSLRSIWQERSIGSLLTNSSAPLSISKIKFCHLRPISFATVSRARSYPDPYNPPFDSAPLPGSAPQHNALLLLHSSSRPVNWPARMEIASSLMGVITRKMKALGGLANFAWGINKLEYGVEWKDSEEFAATLYRRGMPPVDIPSLTTANLDQVLTPLLKSNSMLPSSQANDQGRNLHFFVCTHGERDCRCGAVGVEVANALREELNRLKTPDGTVDGWSFKVGEVGHVGGHKFAANVLVYPEGHWYGNLRPSDIPSFVRDHLDRTSTSEGIPPSTLLRKHWRGSMHLSGEEQVRQYEMATKSDSASVTSSEPVSSFNPRGGDEVIITYTSHDGKAKHPVIAKIGESLMEVATRAQLEGIEGVCEGKLECATCHVYLSQNPLPAPVPKMFDEEEDMLEYALFRNEAESRLGCQIQVTKELAKWNQEGGVIRLPRY